jgi:uncharacterized protein
MESIDRFFKEPGQSFFLFGPRGTGKTTWLKRRFQDALWLDLLAPDQFRAYSARPEALKHLVHGNPDNRVIVIDEVQRVPELLNVVHGLIEEDPTRMFILTGSSSRKLKRSGVDLMAGRAVLRSLHPFLAAELGERFRIDEALRIGLVPLVTSAPDPSAALKSYLSLYVREEVQAEGLVRKTGDFSRFLEAMSFSHGTTLNVSNVARDCEVERKTVEGYVGILEDLLLGFRVPVFSRRAQRATAVHPKFYFFDAGVFRSVRPAGPLDRPAEIEGPALEGLVAQHLRAWIAYRGGDEALYFWRTRSGVEVDFVLYGSGGFLGIEVKNAARIDGRDLKGLQAFRQDYPECKPLLLYRGQDRILRDGVLCMPCEAFLRSLRPESPIPAEPKAR